MKLVLVAATLLAFGISGLLAETPNDAEKAVFDTEKAWRQAIRENDAATLEAIELEEYTLTNSRGIVSSRADDIREAENKLVQYEQFENEDSKIRIYGDAAIVTGRTLVKGTSLGKKLSAEFKFTDMLVRRDGKWRAAAAHVTRMK